MDMQSIRSLSTVGLGLLIGACAAPGNPTSHPFAGTAYGPVTAPVPQTAPASPAKPAQNAADLAKAAQNPVANMISLPLQNNTSFGIGPGDDTQNVLNIQPVWPVQLNEHWNLITRTILPIVDQPLPTGGSEFGLGDTTFTGFFSPAKADDGVTWGVGPVLLLPTSTDDALGVGEWGGGVSAVALVMPGHWVVGALANNVWSFESSAINSFLLQPFVNYNLEQGWFLTFAPILTADWEAPSGEQWTVPLGGGVGRLLRIGEQPVSFTVQYYDNVEAPTGAADWQLRVALQFLFPKG